MYSVTADQVHEICASYSDLAYSFKKHHCQTPADLKDMLLSTQHEDSEMQNHLLVRAAWDRGAALGLKAAAVFPANRLEDAELPAIHAIYVLYDGSTGKPAAVIDGTSMTYYKTAADSALGGQMLANKEITSMAMIGAGAMAPHLIRAHCEMHPSIRHVTVWNRSAWRAKYLAETLKIDNVDIKASEDLKKTVCGAELVSSATMTKDPIIQGDWISPGTHIDLIGAFTPDMREADDTAIAKSRVFVDSRRTTIGEIGEITIPIENGTIAEDDVLADLYELCSGQVQGRLCDKDITLFKNGGGGHLDLMTAQYIYSKITS